MEQGKIFTHILLNHLDRSSHKSRNVLQHDFIKIAVSINMLEQPNELWRWIISGMFLFTFELVCGAGCNSTSSIACFIIS